MGTTAELEQEINVLRKAYDAFNRGDIAAAVESLDPQIEWTEPAQFPGGGTYHGVAEVKQYLTQSRDAWAEVRSEPERFIPAGNRIVVFVHARVRPKGSDEWQDVHLADVYTLRPSRCRHLPTDRRHSAQSESKTDAHVRIVTACDSLVLFVGAVLIGEV